MGNDTSLKSPAQCKKNMTQGYMEESAEEKLQSTINSIGEQSALLLMAVGDCVINKKSQARRLPKSMAYQEVECSEPCLERRNTRKEVSSTNKKEKGKYQRKLCRKQEVKK